MLSSTTSDTPVRGDVWIVNWPTTPCACAVQTSLREERRLSPEKHVTLRVCAGKATTSPFASPGHSRHRYARSCYSHRRREPSTAASAIMSSRRHPKRSRIENNETLYCPI